MIAPWRTACYAVSVALLGAAALLPVSRWAFRNHVDVLTGGWGTKADWSDTYIYPIRVLKKFDAVPELRDYETSTAEANSADPITLSRVYKRTLQKMSSFKYGEPKKHTNEMGQNYREQIEVALRGTKADPDNAFFWTMLAGSHFMSGNLTSCTKTLERASTCKKFDSYSGWEESDRYISFLDKAGYRGDRAREAILSAFSLPHLGVLRSMAQDLRWAKATRDTVQAQADLLRVADLIQRTSPSSVEVLSARNVQRKTLVLFAVNPKMRESNVIASYAPQFLDKQRKFNVPRPFDATASVATSDQLVASWMEVNGANDDRVYLAHGFWPTAAAPAALLSLILAVAIMMLIPRMKPASRQTQRLVPFLLATAAFWLTTVPGFREEPGTTVWLDLGFTVCMVIFGFLQRYDNLARFALIGGVVACVAVAAAAYSFPIAYLPTVCLLVGTVAIRAQGKLPSLFVGSAMVGYCLAVALVAVKLVLYRGADTWLAYTFVALMVIGLALLASGSRKLTLVAPIAILFLSASYVVGVAYDLKQNEMIRASIDGWQHQAELMRAKAGLPTPSG